MDHQAIPNTECEVIFHSAKWVVVGGRYPFRRSPRNLSHPYMATHGNRVKISAACKRYRELMTFLRQVLESHGSWHW